MTEEYIQNMTGVNVFDIRLYGDYSFSAISDYLNQDDVRKALFVDPRYFKNSCNYIRVPGWTPESDEVGYILEEGEQGSSADLFVELLENYRVLIYNGKFLPIQQNNVTIKGEYDMDCNFMGTDLWLSQLQWKGQSKFNNLPRYNWKVNNGIVGSYRQLFNLTQLIINNAGHLTPKDQPEVSLIMLETFLQNKQFGQ